VAASFPIPVTGRVLEVLAFAQKVSALKAERFLGSDATKAPPE
jgi:hypothetical protein